MGHRSTQPVSATASPPAVETAPGGLRPIVRLRGRSVCSADRLLTDGWGNDFTVSNHGNVRKTGTGDGDSTGVRVFDQAKAPTPCLPDVFGHQESAKLRHGVP